MISTTEGGRRLNLLLGLLLAVAATGYVAAGYRQQRTINLSATAGGQYPYLLNAQEIARVGVTNDFGDRNRMPMIPALVSTAYTQDWVMFTDRAGQVAIASSLALLVGVGAVAFASLPALPATFLTLLAGVCVFMPKASFVQAELAYYALLFAAWRVMCRVIYQPDWRWAAVAGVLCGLAFWAKASAWPLMLAFIFAMVFRSTLVLRTAGKVKQQNPTAPPDFLAGPATVAAVTVASFLLVVSPYLLDNHAKFDRYFYNVNSTFFMWCDSWAEATSFSQRHDLAGRFPDAPFDELPSAARYLQTHTLTQIGQRFAYGVGTLFRLAFHAAYFKYFAILSVFCLFVGWKRRSLLRLMDARDWIVVSFCATVLLGYSASYAWYALVAYGDRFVLSLVLPTILSLSWFAWRFGQRCAFITIGSRCVGLVRVMFWLFVGALTLEGVSHGLHSEGAADKAFVQFYFNESREAQRSGAADVAVRGYLGVIQLDPTFAHAHHELGMIALRAGHTDEAVDALSRAAFNRPNDANMFNSLGSAFIQANRIEQAIEALSRAVTLDPQFASAWYNLGGAYHTIGDQARAEEARRVLDTIDKRMARQLGALLQR